jgi:mannose-6-phosphate isomerase-like protein (cupin superfamily)
MHIITADAHPREEWRPGVETRMLISALIGAQQLCIFEQWVAPAKGTPVHSHSVEEVLTVLAGEAAMWIDDRDAVLEAGQSLVIPAHKKHGFRNVGSGILHVHAVLSSPIFEAFVEGVDAPVRRWLGDSESMPPR